MIFTVGASDPKTTDYSGILKKNFSSELLSKTKIFHLHGGINYKKLGFTHKLMMAMAKKFRVDNKPSEQRSEEDRIFLETYGESFDFTEKSTIKPLIDFVRTQ